MTRRLLFSTAAVNGVDDDDYGEMGFGDDDGNDSASMVACMFLRRMVEFGGCQ